MKIFFGVFTLVWFVLGMITMIMDWAGFESSDLSRHAFLMMITHLGFFAVLDRLDSRP
jgi:hypothetical protein